MEKFLGSTVVLVLGAGILWWNFGGGVTRAVGEIASFFSEDPNSVTIEQSLAAFDNFEGSCVADAFSAQEQIGVIDGLGFERVPEALTSLMSNQLGLLAEFAAWKVTSPLPEYEGYPFIAMAGRSAVDDPEPKEICGGYFRFADGDDFVRLLKERLGAEVDPGSEGVSPDLVGLVIPSRPELIITVQSPGPSHEDVLAFALYPLIENQNN